MFRILKIKEGDPICVKFDLQITEKLFYDVTTITLIPISE